MNSIHKVAVIGAGIMGHGIAQCCAQAGKGVLLVDSYEKALTTAKIKIEKNIELLIANGFLQGSPGEILSRVKFSTELNAVNDVDIVIEAVPEDSSIKKSLFSKLGRICRKDCILASNTSAVPITTIAEGTQHPERVIGTHFFQPAHLIPLVEVIQTAASDEQVIQSTISFMSEIGKKPVRVKKDIPGFVANRLQQALTREAVSLIQKGIVTAKDLDTIVTTSFALRMIFTGPIEQKDLNGIDTYVSVAKLVAPDLEDAKEPLAMVEAMVAAGELGVKTGTGFYDWTGKSPIEIYNDKNKELLDLLAFLNKRQIHS